MQFEYKLENVSLLAESNTGEEDNYLFEDGKGLDKQVNFKLYRVSKTSKHEIGSFSFSPMPGCCGVVVSHFTYLHKDMRGQGLSDAFRQLKEDLAKALGYSMMIATTQMENLPAVGNMMKSKYHMPVTFTNKRTNKLLGLGYKVIK